MKLIGLNCQGLGNDPTVRALSDLRRRFHPDVVFLSETHLDVFPAECIRRRLQMDMKIVNPSAGRSGGLLLLWKKEISICYSTWCQVDEGGYSSYLCPRQRRQKKCC
jgi:hypothetical protein